jgi:hypothetical protein
MKKQKPLFQNKMAKQVREHMPMLLQPAKLFFNCTAGMGSIEALKMAGEENLTGKIIVDLANALDFSNGMPPSLAIVNTNSLGEEIQKLFHKQKL